MITLIVDDNPNIVDSMRAILEKIDPTGRHYPAESGAQALQIARSTPVDVAFLDIEMPAQNGLEVARRLQSIQPLINIVFITGHSEYALQAFDVFASGYLLKPITEAQVQRTLVNLRHESAAPSGKRLRVQCFGSFELWCDGNPVKFKRSNSKMLLAYLVDRRGAMCDIQQMICALWPEESDTVSLASQLRVFIADLQTTFTKLNIGEVLVRDRGLLGIRAELMECDYYEYLNGSPKAMHAFRGEYMSQYSFGEVTLAALQRKLFEEQ